MMNNRNFRQLIEAKWAQGRFLCVGLDSDYEKIPACVAGRNFVERITSFNQAIIDATKEYVCAYKPNTAFYEAYGEEGWSVLRETIAYIHEKSPDVPVILDAKRADIGNTNNGYVREAFTFLKADAITVHPYMGGEALEPFLAEKDKGIIILCKTSNPGSSEFQNLIMSDGEPLYCHVARQAANQWNKNGNCGLVAGGTYPEELRRVRENAGDLPLLIPGIGAQGGDLEKTLLAGMDSRKSGVIISVSRSILFASSHEDFAGAARRETMRLHQQIIEILK